MRSKPGIGSGYRPPAGAPPSAATRPRSDERTDSTTRYARTAVRTTGASGCQGPAPSRQRTSRRTSARTRYVGCDRTSKVWTTVERPGGGTPRPAPFAVGAVAEVPARRCRRRLHRDRHPELGDGVHDRRARVPLDPEPALQTGEPATGGVHADGRRRVRQVTHELFGDGARVDAELLGSQPDARDVLVVAPDVVRAVFRSRRGWHRHLAVVARRRRAQRRRAGDSTQRRRQPVVGAPAVDARASTHVSPWTSRTCAPVGSVETAAAPVGSADAGAVPTVPASAAVTAAVTARTSTGRRSRIRNHHPWSLEPHPWGSLSAPSASLRASGPPRARDQDTDKSRDCPRWEFGLVRVGDCSTGCGDPAAPPHRWRHRGRFDLNAAGDSRKRRTGKDCPLVLAVRARRSPLPSSGGGLRRDGSLGGVLVAVECGASWVNVRSTLGSSTRT